MTYHQLTDEERYTIAALRKEGLNQAQIAQRLQRHRSTISREVRRNAARLDGAYRAQKAIERTNGRRSRSRRNSRFGRGDWQKVERLLRLDWSPEQAAGVLRRSRELSISHETIYRYVWEDRARGGNLAAHLRGANKKRRKRYGRYDSRGRLAGKRHISTRAKFIERRCQVGHWEIDTVMGGGDTHCIMTLVERATGYLMIRKLRSRNAADLARSASQLIKQYEGKFRTITADNGTEFHSYKSIESKTDVKFYFATPYHSWERGTNENTNGLIRQYLPKRTSMAKVTQRDCDRIALKLNTRPRKRYAYRTPKEIFDAA